MMLAACLSMALGGVGSTGEETYRSDPASGRDGADGAGGLAEGVAEHIKGGI